MAKQPTQIEAASLLTAWTDADTAMQIVGTSLGVFGGGLDPTAVLATETPLRNALFDVLLSLVEGGALDLRTTDGSRYAFRWRADIAIAGLSTDDETVIDLAVPSPYLADLQRAEAERDDALGRAEFAEALAAERERQLRVVGVRGQTEPPEPAQSVEAEPAPAKRASRAAAPKTAPRKAPASKPAAKKSAAKKPAAVRPAATEPVEIEPVTVEPVAVAPAAVAPAAVAPEPIPEAIKALAATAPAPKKPAAKKPAPRKSRKAAAVETPEPEVVYLTPPVDIDLTAEPEAEQEQEPAEPSRKWSGYTIEKARKHLTSVDRLVDEG